MSMNKQQAKIILLFAENDMEIKTTAKQLYMTGSAVAYQLDKIRKQMGWNPRKFYDLCYLVGVAAQRCGAKQMQ